MEVRLVTAASRGFFFLSRVDHVKAWYDFIATQKEESRKDKDINIDGGEGSSSSLPTDDLKAREFSYTDLFENSIPQNCFAISEDQQTRDEVEESLRKIASKVHVLYSKAKGGSNSGLKKGE